MNHDNSKVRDWWNGTEWVLDRLEGSQATNLVKTIQM